MYQYYQPGTVLFVGNGRLPSASSISAVHGEVSISFAMVVDVESGRIVDVAVTFRTDIVTAFIRSMLIGRCLDTEYEDIFNDLKTRVQGIANKAIVSAFRGAYERYRDYKIGVSLEN